MQKQGYRHSTTKYCIQALKAIARKSSLLRPESAKGYLATAPISESRKAKLTEDLARFYALRLTELSEIVVVRPLIRTNSEYRESCRTSFDLYKCFEAFLFQYDLLNALIPIGHVSRQGKDL